MEVGGIDPPAPRMQSECSTIWATLPYVWWFDMSNVRRCNLPWLTRDRCKDRCTPRCEDSVAEWSKAIDLKSIILRMRRFKSCHCRFLFQPRADFCVSDVVDVDEQSKQDNVAEWLRRLPAKEFPFGA